MNDETLNAIFYNPDHTKRYNPSGKPTGVVLTDFDIMEAKQAIMQLIKEDRERVIKNIGEPLLNSFDIKPESYDDVVKTIKWYDERIAQLSNSAQEKGIL